MDIGAADHRQNVELCRAHSFQREIEGLVGMQMRKIQRSHFTSVKTRKICSSWFLRNANQRLDGILDHLVLNFSSASGIALQILSKRIWRSANR